MSIPRRTELPYSGRAADPIVVRLEGEYDVFTTGRLWETLAQATTQGDAGLIIDLSRVELMDAVPVGVIIRAGYPLRRRSRSLALRCPPSEARRILEVCGLARLVEGGAG